MSVLLTRRKVISGMGLLGIGMLAGCDTRGELSYKYGKDLSNKILGRTFRLKDTDGEVRTLSSYRGVMPMIFLDSLNVRQSAPQPWLVQLKSKK